MPAIAPPGRPEDFFASLAEPSRREPGSEVVGMVGLPKAELWETGLDVSSVMIPEEGRAEVEVGDGDDDGTLTIIDADVETCATVVDVGVPPVLNAGAVAKFTKGTVFSGVGGWGPPWPSSGWGWKSWKFLAPGEEGTSLS